MRTRRTLLPALILAAVSLTFVGAAAALEDDGPAVDEPTTVPVPECSTAEGPDETVTDELDADVDAADDDQACDEAPEAGDDDEADEADEAESSINPS